MVFVVITIALSLLGLFINNSYTFVDNLKLIDNSHLSDLYIGAVLLALFIIWSYCYIMNIIRQKRINKYKEKQKENVNIDCIGDGLMGVDCSDCIDIAFDCDDCVDLIECSDGIDCGDCIDGVDCLDCGSGLDCGDCLSGADCGGIDCG